MTPSLHRRALLAGLALLPGCARASAPVLGPPARPFLEPLGALALDTSPWGFGGLSALHLAPDLTLTAISDLGRWWRAPLVLREGRLSGIGEVRHGPLRDAAGQPLRRGSNGDAESLARLPDGDWLVGFERRHRILRFRDLAGPGQPIETPPGLEEAPGNGGLEGLAILADGRLLALAESLPGAAGPESRAAWFGTLNGGRVTWRRTSYIPAAGMDPTDAAGLPDGGALVLERRFSIFGGFTGRLAHLPAAAPRGVEPLRGETWLDLPPDAPAENWEGVAVARHGGRTLVVLVSDDNQSPFQETLLLLYALR
ncbi:esterase-like activity of phytase family protein [Sediminicoccus sp. BL-A-41-H5]|uniref:esterase-like activity of phytase family protein n=1 Tax=Sediminicoccus sp. BL-A-41-H5 TaxID=3421106 RepID=UPI003D6643CD